MTSLRLYRIPTPYFLICDEDPLLERSAMLAGLIKGNHEELNALLHSIARLTSVTAPQEEIRAKELLNAIIAMKRRYVASETHRAIKTSYEADH